MSLSLEWLRQGWQISVPVTKLLNDNLDIFYIAYGTCFDGVLSGDQKLQHIALIAESVLREYRWENEAAAPPEP